MASMRRKRLGDSTLFPSPTQRSRDALARLHFKYVKQFDELQRDGHRLCQLAEQEPNPGARARMKSLCKDMSSGMSDQATAGMIQYRARTIYDPRY
jgi:hypothetical protein